MSGTRLRIATLGVVPLLSAAFLATGVSPAAAVTPTVTLLSMSATPVVDYTQPALVSTRLTTSTGAPVAGQTVALFTKSHIGTTWSQVATAKTNTSGAAALAKYFSANTDVQWRYAGNATHTAALSPVGTTMVRPLLTVVRRPMHLSLGHSFLISGTVKPHPAGQVVQLQQFFLGAWHITKTTTSDSTGAFAFAVKPAVTGIYTYRVSVPADATHVTATSGAFRTVVYFVWVQAVHFMPMGMGSMLLNDEYVVLRNTGRVPVNLAGWKLLEARQGLAFHLPAYLLNPGASVVVHDGSGTTRAGHVYLGCGKRIWSAVHDVLSIYNTMLALDMRRAW